MFRKPITVTLNSPQPDLELIRTACAGVQSSCADVAKEIAETNKVLHSDLEGINGLHGALQAIHEDLQELIAVFRHVFEVPGNATAVEVEFEKGEQ